MQTFVPYADIKKTVKCLDYRRLGCQRKEAKQILDIIREKRITGPWVSHPAVIMWKQNPDFLTLYYNCCLSEWTKRGYKNNMKYISFSQNPEPPVWWGDNRIHSSHRQTLLFKNYDYYKQFGWKEEPKYEYFWPSHNEDYKFLVERKYEENRV